jgi:hypothetical protein
LVSFTEKQLRPLTCVKRARGRNWRPLDDDEKEMVKKCWDKAVREHGPQPTENDVKRIVHRELADTGRVTPAAERELGARPGLARIRETVALSRDLPAAVRAMSRFYTIKELEEIVRLINEEIGTG